MMNEKTLTAARRALLGNVTPNLRAIFIDILDEATKMSLIYDISLSELEETLTHSVQTQFQNFLLECKIDFSINVVNYPNRLPQFGNCVYRKYEPSIP